MAEKKVFIDGAEGTTGLRIRERLADRQDLSILTLGEAQRKDLPSRLHAMEEADLSILCLPDHASREIVELASPHTRICDTSTAYRTHPDWVYGFPELSARRKEVHAASRVCVPGCHATGFLALTVPLVEQGVLPKNVPLVCHSLTGYSGGGKKMIAAYEGPDKPESYNAPRLYALGLQHKHLPEMQAVAKLPSPPLFCPVVDDYYCGMLVYLSLPMHSFSARHRSGEDLAALYAQYYADEPLFTVHEAGELPEDGTLSAKGMAGRDTLEIFTLGNPEQILLAARFDNLGKGASGAAIQCMNLMLGLPETSGLVL
ncbi:N-acetyl-gamma-glutamyl-phosphate reductase [Ruminococcaceae bacterium OttesenSCG-928-I18]|nr:N-acetyl-gamma-glutamyl-phosphate reductase [Ruminococcaceae bacterium OttesenSCG-928-I18]